MTRMITHVTTIPLGIVVLAVTAIGCGGDDSDEGDRPTAGAETTDATESTGTEAGQQATSVDEVVEIDGKRGLYVQCTGSGSPTVVMEAGDADTGSAYAGVTPALAETTRACVYDRANLGQSDPAPGPRGLDDYVGDLERLLDRAEIPGPYVLVGSSGGGYISVGYALANPKEAAGIVLFDTFPPDPNPPKEVVQETDPNNPANVERRDYLQMENDAWNARRTIGDLPVRVVSVDYGDLPPGSPEATSVKGQRGWLVLSSQAKQVVSKSGHDVVGEDPEFATDVILDVVKAAR